MAQSEQLKIVRVKFEAQNSQVLNSIAKETEKVNKNLKKTNDTLSTFKKVWAATLGASVVKASVTALTTMSDTYSLMNNRLEIFTGSAEGAKSAMEGISQVAKENFTSIESVGTVYNRLALALSDVGISSQGVLAITDTLIKTFRLSGSTVAEATAATIQLSQGLASGALRGQEMRSVLEQNAVVGDILAKSFNIGRGQLMKYAEAGMFTSDVVINALAKNQDMLREKSAKLGITFEQVGLKIKNELLVSVGELATSMDVAGKLATGVDWLVERLPQVTASLAGMAAVIAGFKLVAWVKGLVAAGLTLKAVFLASNPLGWAAAIGLAIYGVVANFKYLANRTEYYWKASIGVIKQVIVDIISAVSMLTSGTKLESFFKGLDGVSKSLQKDLVDNQKALQGLDEELKKVQDTTKKGAGNIETLPSTAIKDFKTQLKELNLQYQLGIIDLEKYNKKTSELERAKIDETFETGAVNLEKYNEELRKLEMINMGKMFADGRISAEMLNEAIRNNNLEKLDRDFRMGRISLLEYKTELISIREEFMPGSALYVGTSEFIKAAGTISQGVAGAITHTFDTLANSLSEFIKTGTFNFKKFTSDILDEINKIIVRALVVKPIAGAILGSFGGPSGAGGAMATSMGGPNVMSAGFAKGGAFSNGVEMFAKGGVVNSPTAFTYNGGKPAVMGEAGTEAILPLTRGANGDLGVQASGAGVIINVINNSGAEIEQQESEGPGGTRTIDLIISAKVKEGFTRGDFDSTMKRNYGLDRRGA